MRPHPLTVRWGPGPGRLPSRVDHARSSTILWATIQHCGTTGATCVLPRTHPSCRGRADDCIARMMRKSNRARSTSVEAPFTWFNAGAAPRRAAPRRPAIAHAWRSAGDRVSTMGSTRGTSLAPGWSGLARFAELTCVEITEPPDRRSDRPPRSTSTGLRSGGQSPPRRPHAGPPLFSAALRRIGAHRRLIYPGHRRRLRAGQQR
jgi:hypothetical protein